MFRSPFYEVILTRSLHHFVISEISYHDIKTYFKSIQHQPWACLLDSCQQGNIGHHFDIITTEPCLTYEYHHGTTKIEGKEKQLFNLEKDLDAFGTIAELHSQLIKSIDISKDIAKRTAHLPFMVGAMSAFSYDTHLFGEKLKPIAPNKYRLPEISVGFYTASIIYDNQANCAHIFDVDHVRAEQTIDALLNIKTLANKALSHQQSFHLLSPWCSNLSKSKYLKQIDQIRHYLQAGDCYQVNFAQRFTSQYTGSEYEAYELLSERNQAPYSAFMRFAHSCVLSLSPERFLQVNDKQVSTKPIKGTRPRSGNQEQDHTQAQLLLDSEKDRAENLMIVDLLRNDLSKHCEPNSVKVPKLFALESYPAVHHMVSTVEGKLRSNSNMFELFKGAFPGGSITGAPKLRAMQVIQELEPDSRSIYCGSIGYFCVRNRMDSNICIRTILAEDDTMHCWAGGGIVLDSDAENEYQETLDKIAKILPLLSSVDCEFTSV